MVAQRRNGGLRRPTVWTSAGLAALAVVVLVLAVVALNQNRSVSGAGSTPGAGAPGEPETTQAVVTEEPAVVPTVVPGRVLAALDASSAVRASVTTCPEATNVEVTSDGGASWEPFAAEGIASVQRVTAGAGAFIGLIGLAVEGCGLTFERSFTAGVGWEAAPDELASSWFVDPADRTVVHSPAGDRVAPCRTAVQVAVVDENVAAVLCEDGFVHATVDAAASWLPPASVPGAGAITTGGTGYRVAVLNQGDCVGAQLVEVSVTEAGSEGGAVGACLQATVAPGEVAIATGDEGTMWLWAGDVLGRTVDGGGTWL